jgi:hypothetical protein
MIVLVLIAAWILVLSLVMGACTSARSGDAQLLHELAGSGQPRVNRLAWEAGAETIRITAARAGVRAVGGEELLVSDSRAA